MKISFRDRTADMNSLWRDQSETQNNFPQKPLDIDIKIDKKRDLSGITFVGINVLNHLQNSKKLQERE